jgi:hypothetical protein
MIFRTLVAYLPGSGVCFFFKKHTKWPQKVNLWAAILGVHITGPLLFILILIILLLLLFDNFRDRLWLLFSGF